MQKNKDGFDFEPFAKTREYLKVNADIVTTWIDTMLKNGISGIDSLLDIATGSGTMSQLILARLPQHWENFVLTCLDQSEEALSLAKLELVNKVKNLRLVHSPIQEMKLPDSSIHVAIWGNGIHYLTEEAQRKSIMRIKHALKPGGWFFFNTAFYEGARPIDTLPFYRAQVKKAVQLMREKSIDRNRMESRPEASKFLPRSYYEKLVEEASFKIIDTKEFSVNLYKKAWEHISSFRQYAAGALHGYAPQEAAMAMKNAVAIALANYGQRDEKQESYIPRKWLAISARL